MQPQQNRATQTQVMFTDFSEMLKQRDKNVGLLGVGTASAEFEALERRVIDRQKEDTNLHNESQRGKNASNSYPQRGSKWKLTSDRLTLTPDSYAGNSNSNSGNVNNVRQNTVLDPQKMRPSRTRLRRIEMDLARGDVEEATLIMIGRTIVAMNVRGVTHRVATFVRCKIGTMDSNSAARRRYGTTDAALLIKPRVNEDEATFTLAGAILALTVPNFMHCFDIFKDGPMFFDRMNHATQKMVIVLQKVPHELMTYLSLLKEMNDRRIMLQATASVSCQCLLSLYAYSALTNICVSDRHAGNGMVSRTSSATIDYSKCPLLSGIQQLIIPTLPKLPGSAFFGRLIMIDFGQMAGLSSQHNHFQSNLEAMLENPNTTQLHNHLDDPAADTSNILYSCEYFLITLARSNPELQMAADVFARARNDKTKLEPYIVQSLIMQLLSLAYDMS